MAAHTPQLTALRRFLKGEFFRHGFLVFTAMMIANLLSYAFRFLAARHVSVVEYGVLSSLFAFVNLFFAPAAILAIIVTKYSSEFTAVDDFGRLRTLKRWVSIGGTAVAVAIAGIVYLFRFAIAGYFGITDTGAVAATGLIVAVYFLLPNLWAILQGSQRFREFSLVIAIDGFAKVSLGLLALFAGYHVAGALFAYAAGGMLAIAYVSFQLRTIGTSPEPVPIHLDARRLLQSMAGVAVSTIAVTMMGSMDSVLVQHFFHSRIAGLYGAITVCGKALLLMVGFLPAIVLPKAAALANQGESAQPILVQALGLALIISGSGLVLYRLNPGFVITLMAGAKYGLGAPYVFKYGLAMVLLACITIAANYRMGLHRFGYVVPLAGVALAELAVIQIGAHGSIDQVIQTLIVGHAVALVCVLLGTKDHGVASSRRRAGTD